MEDMTVTRHRLVDHTSEESMEGVLVYEVREGHEDGQAVAVEQ